MATVLTFELRVFEQSLVFFLIAKMKPLGYNVAQVPAV
jgi:hypothetical protein